jgi:CIC family chloride channel protein
MMPGIGHLFERMPAQTRAALQTCLYGLAAGAVAVAFQVGINWVYRAGLFALSHQSFSTFLIGSFAVVVCSSLIVGWLLNSFCRDAAGSGIPQFKLAFWKDFGTVPWRVTWVKFLAGIISIGGGASLGREGPSVQLAGSAGSNLAGLLREPKQNRRAAAAAGAAAGLAAAFNTPLAAATFVLEEIIGDLNSRYLGRVILASVLGALVVHGAIGRHPSFTLTGGENPSWVAYALTPLVAALASVIGVYFQKASLQLRAKMKTQARIPPFLLPLTGGLITWGLGVLVFWQTQRLGVFSLGYDDLSDALAAKIGWQLAVILLFAKFIATFTCYGFGGCGGIFSPTLFFGGMAGVLVAGLVNLQLPVSASDTVALAVVGMSACLGAVVWAPVTGILIVFEMTHEFGLVPVLMIGALVSQAISRRMNKENFYDALLTQDNHHIEHVRPPRDLKSWQQLPVAVIANFQPVMIPGLNANRIKEILEAYPYQRFPVVENSKLAGILSRKEAASALAENRLPHLEPPTTCLTTDSIRDLEVLLIQSTTQTVVVLDQLDGKVMGLVTLHDLLRAQVERSQGTE